MYSTSSSECECECDEYCTYMAGVYGNPGIYGRSPFYPTMGHPLIYHAQVQPPSQRQRSRESRKEKKNCFAKAFKWYTEEHVPYRSSSPYKTEMNAFAAWLDSKYDEFLRDSQLDSVYHLKIKQTSVIEADRIPDNTCCEPRSKRFRGKSPWRRKRRNSGENAGDGIQKPNQSFQFILHPKELTRPASECCPSDATTISTELPMRSTIRSQSYTLISHEPADIKTCDGKPENNVGEPNNYAGDENKSEHKALQNISCQCSKVEVEKINAHSQYENMVAERVAASDNQVIRRKTCQPCHKFKPNNKILKAPVQEVPAKMPFVYDALFCHCSGKLIPKADSHIQYQTHNVERDASLSNIQSSSKIVKNCPCESEEVVKVENLTSYPVPITFSNDGAQTSSHSISLEKDAVHGYPLFIKIVCADKLCK